ncbi:unnamed protein product [Rhizoctonia solani]|uniref:Peptidase C14 caspase domain-containing protein n=1 Tax=Rhizoctonia solani TaxID=456999 RepID=A0A8H3DJA9_9AGAM|nr:unnamed protein product [Rhizoctonia solani]
MLVPGSKANQSGANSPGSINPEVERGLGAVNIQQGCLGLAVPPLNTIQKLRSAIELGDCLPNKPTWALKGAQRRALLVAIQYEADARLDAHHLPSTPNDILSIYNMLVKRGYEASNIRILSEGFVKNLSSNPTKRNLQLSLEWLVEGAQPGDYRYFHFSGHGVAFENKSGQGKVARVIPESLADRKADDSEVIPLDSSDLNEGGTASDQRGTRISRQKVPLNELKCYNEAMLTLWESPSLEERAYIMRGHIGQNYVKLGY